MTYCSSIRFWLTPSLLPVSSLPANLLLPVTRPGFSGPSVAFRMTTAIMGDVMETEEEVDYSEDPHLEQVIFRCPNFSSAEAGSSRPSNPSTQSTSPVVSLPDHRPTHPTAGNSPRGSPALDLPPLSPGTLRFLSNVIPPSPPFNPHPHNTTPLAATSSGPPTSAPAAPSASLHSSSGCFETPAIRVRSSKAIHLEGSLDPLVNHTFAPRTGKKRTKCVKTTSRDISIRLEIQLLLGKQLSWQTPY